MLIYLIILRVIHLSTCYDIEIQAQMRVKKDLLNILNGLSSESSKSSEDPNGRRIPEVTFLNINETSENIAARKLFHADQFVFDYKKNLTEKGCRRLVILDKSLREKLDLKIDNSIETVIMDYKSELKDNFEMIDKYKTEYDYNWKLVLCDIIETTTNILYNFKKKLINHIVNKNNTDISKVRTIIAKVFKESVYDKRDEFNHICEEANVCRIYPGFSDYIADLISEILKLNNTKFELAIKHLQKLVKSKVNFLRKVIPDDIIILLGTKAKTADEKDLQMRELLSVLSAAIVQRYKLVPTKDEGVKMRKSAIRILLDIVDKAFAIEDESLTSIHFDSTVKGLRQYAAGYRKDINSTLHTFVNNIVRVLKHNLDKTTKDEVKALVDIIFKGTCEDMDRFRYLFTRGSNFVPEQ